MNSLIICDLDGTLIDSKEDIANSINLMRIDYGLDPLPLDIITGYIGNGAKNLVIRSLQELKINLNDALGKFKIYYDKNILNKTCLYPDVVEGLTKLHNNGFKLAVISNKPESACIKILDYFEITKNFDVIAGGESKHPLKPDPASVYTALYQTGSSAIKSWIIGDSLVDLEVGRCAGIRCCYAAYGFFKLNEKLFDLSVYRFREFVDFLCFLSSSSFPSHSESE